jgi:hypothetical protein
LVTLSKVRRADQRLSAVTSASQWSVEVLVEGLEIAEVQAPAATDLGGDGHVRE